MTTYGYFFVESNQVHVDMHYETVLSVSVVDSTVTLDAAVTNNGNPVRAGINVDFYVSYEGGGYGWFANQLTDANGVAQAIYTAAGVGGYDFKATATVP